MSESENLHAIILNS